MGISINIMKLVCIKTYLLESDVEPAIPVHGKLRQEDSDFKARIGNIVKLHVKSMVSKGVGDLNGM